MNQDKQSAELSTSSAGSRPGWFVWVAMLVIVAAGFYYFRKTDTAAQGHDKEPANAKTKDVNRDGPPVSIAAATTRQGDMPIYLNGLGTVTALKTVTVHSRVDGELIKVAFTEGQLVHQGDLLVEIDPRPYQVLLKQAEGALIRDQALLANAKIDLQRYKTLQEQDSIAQQQTATQLALVRQYEGTVEMDQSQVDNANLQLTYARITAPVSGRIGLRLVDQGNIVHATDANGLVVITQLEPIAVIFTLPEDAVPAVMQRWRKEQNIMVDAYDRAGVHKLASGKVLAVDNQIDTTTGTLKLKAQFDNQERTLFANQFVNIKMHLDTLKAATLAPTAAIQRGTDGAFVFVLKDDNSVTTRQVKTGPIDGDLIAISEGLSPNEKLVIDGMDKLRDGSRVNVVKLDNIPVQPKTGPEGQAQSGKPHAPS